MPEVESWESKCCRCEGEPKVDLYPGKRACHVACGSCLYPADWSRCQSCELVTHCMYAVEYLRNMKMKSSEKGCLFKDQLNGEESLYHALNFVNAQQQLLNTHGEKRYIKELREENAGSRCLKK
ncbi:MAG: hypothetical protein WCD81_11045 [Candidatus Bathyarchaeia archaeon]